MIIHVHSTFCIDKHYYYNSSTTIIPLPCVSWTDRRSSLRRTFSCDFFSHHLIHRTSEAVCVCACVGGVRVSVRVWVGGVSVCV